MRVLQRSTMAGAKEWGGDAPRGVSAVFAALTALLTVLGVGPAASALGAERPNPPPGRGLDRGRLVAELGRIVANPALRRMRVGVAVRDLVTGETLFEHNADDLYATASNNKVITTAAALELLGPSFQFRTMVSAVGRLRPDGVLEGNLVVVGRGDPSISGRFHEGDPTAILDAWVRAVADAGVRTIRGDLVADDTYFDRQHQHPDWPHGQELNWYCAPISALSYNDNCIQVIVRGGASGGAPAVVAVSPPTRYVEVANSCTTSRVRRSGNRVLVRRRLGKNAITVGGEINPGGRPFQTWVTIEEPALYLATVFREMLAAKGIAVSGPARLRLPADRFEPANSRDILTASSSLRTAIGVANKNSQNFYAEQVLKTIGREIGGQGTFAAGAEAVSAFLRQIGIRGAFTYVDGSGLASTNRFSPSQIVDLLAYMNGRRAGGVYLHSLAEPGCPGTLERRLQPLKGRLFAKTGYIANVSCLSGYLEGRRGHLLAFSILINGLHGALGDAKNTENEICMRLADYEP